MKNFKTAFIGLMFKLFIYKPFKGLCQRVDYDYEVMNPNFRKHPGLAVFAIAMHDLFIKTLGFAHVKGEVDIYIEQLLKILDKQHRRYGFENQAYDGWVCKKCQSAYRYSTMRCPRCH